MAALRALATEGIQRGHMALHARNIAILARAEGAEIEAVALLAAAQRRARRPRPRTSTSCAGVDPRRQSQTASHVQLTILGRKPMTSHDQTTRRGLLKRAGGIAAAGAAVAAGAGTFAATLYVALRRRPAGEMAHAGAVGRQHHADEVRTALRRPGEGVDRGGFEIQTFTAGQLVPANPGLTRSAPAPSR